MKHMYVYVQEYLFEYKKYIAMLLWVAWIIFLTVSLCTFNPQDSSFLHYATHPTSTVNSAGFLGAYIAAFFFYVLGGASFLLIPVSIFFGYLWLIKQPLVDCWDQLLGAVLFVVAYAIVLHTDLSNAVADIHTGGYIGRSLSLFLDRGLDQLCKWLVLYMLLFVSLILVVRFSCIGCACKVYKLLCTIMRYDVWYAGARLLGSVLWVITRPTYWLYQASMQLIYNHDELSEHSKSVTMRDEKELQIFAEYEATVETEQLVQDEDEQEQFQAADEVDDACFQELCESTSKTSDAVDVAGTYALPNLNIFIGNQEERDNVEVLQHLQERAQLLEQKLERFGVSGKIVAIKRGPVVTLFEYQPDIDSKISKIIALEDDLALALQALSIRIIAPIPGKPFVGFEVSNNKRKNVSLAQVLRSEQFDKFEGYLPLALGQDTIGNNVIVDLIRMPHLLIAGSTGSGKSVALNSMLVSLLCKMTPDELRLVLIDPKRLEFASYADIAHLLFPIITHPHKAAPVLRWIVRQMEERYELMAQYGARNIQDFNEIMYKIGKERLPFIVLIIDELADLMMTAGREIEDLIARITQMARASGIHLIVATQRPSVDVITGLIKVNFPSRISFRVTSKIDSRTILDCNGADKLLGRGDMLFLDSQDACLKRLHGAYVSDSEIDQLVAHIKEQREVNYLSLEDELTDNDDADKDEIYTEVVHYLEEIDEISISLLQRKFRIGYNRSARIIDMLEAQGLIASSGNGKTRSVIR